MSVLTEKEQKELLQYARSVIAARLNDSAKVREPSDITDQMKEKKGCFVTLHKKGALRGCIGSLEPDKSLLSNIEENAVNAAFRDPRFPPVKEAELPRIDLEISVLTKPKPLEYSDEEDLKKKLKPGVHGVILSRGLARATFLPQVWEQLPTVEMFLGNLCMKAGMDTECWKDPNVEVQVYEVRHFSE